MNKDLLIEAGLNETQAVVYLELIKAGSLTPPQLAAKVQESRTNAYKVLEQLEELKLAKRSQETKKLVYRPENPVALEQLVEQRRTQALTTENKVKASLPQLLDYFFTYSEQPGVRYFQGKSGLTKIYEDHLRTRQDVYFVRTPADDPYFGDVLYKYMKQRAKLGIKAYGLSPYLPGFAKYAAENDAQLNRDMSWVPFESYKAPVEMSIYGNKVSLISFAEEAMGMIIESPQIAEAMRELFRLAAVGGETLRERASNDQ